MMMMMMMMVVMMMMVMVMMMMMMTMMMMMMIMTWCSDDDRMIWSHWFNHCRLSLSQQTNSLKSLKFVLYFFICSNSNWFFIGWTSQSGEAPVWKMWVKASGPCCKDRWCCYDSVVEWGERDQPWRVPEGVGGSWAWPGTALQQIQFDPVRRSSHRPQSERGEGGSGSNAISSLPAVPYHRDPGAR